MGCGAPAKGGCGAGHNTSTDQYGNKNNGGNRANQLDVSALGLVSPLGGGTVLGALNALHATVVLGGVQQQNQLSGLLGGVPACKLQVVSRPSWLVYVHSSGAHSHIRPP